jgi:hypothetical protein
MRIHTSLTESQVRTLAHSVPNVTVAHSATHGSRKRAGAVEIRLHGSSWRSTASGDGKAATWDEWGVFIGKLYRLDPDAIVGQYRSRGDFEDVTHGRFTPEFVATPRHPHKWNFASAFEFECKCGAKMSTRPLMKRG